MDNRWVSDKELISDAKTVAAVHEYFTADCNSKDADRVNKLVNLVKELAIRLEVRNEAIEKSEKARIQHRYTTYVSPPRKSEVTMNDLEAVESRLKDEIDQNWHELKDMIDALSETGKQEGE